MADELRLKVSYADYEQKKSVLQSKMGELEDIYQAYSELKLQAYRVLGDEDSNVERLRATVDKNMEAVGKQHAALKENWDMLSKQEEELSEMTSQIGKSLEEAAKAIQNAANTFKTMSDM